MADYLSASRLSMNDKIMFAMYRVRNETKAAGYWKEASDMQCRVWKGCGDSEVE